MTVGLTIPDVPIVHAREQWLNSCYPMVGPTQTITNITQPVIHYAAALNLPDGDIGEFDYHIPRYLQSANRDYWLNRDGDGRTVCSQYLPGYALGYLFWIDWLGGAWEVRGFDIRAAANAAHNWYTAPLMFITDRDAPASELAWATARAIWREFRRRSGRSDFRNRPLGHGELYTTTGTGTPTACPGPPILAQLHSGLGDLNFNEGTDMFTPWKHSVRAYDSRPTEQDKVDVTLRNANQSLQVPLGILPAFTSRRVFVGMANAAEIVLHAAGRGGPSFARLTGEPAVSFTSLINCPADDWRDNSQIVGLTDGSVWVHAGPNPIDFIVEVANRW